MLTKNFIILITVCLLFVMGSAQIDPACTALCSAFWACVVRSIFGGDQCQAPAGCDCRQF